MTNPDFIGQDADERREQEIEAAVKTVHEIANRLFDEQIFGPDEILTKLIPAIVMDQIGTWSDDFYRTMNKVVFAMQHLDDDDYHASRAFFDDIYDLVGREGGCKDVEGLGCKWSNPRFEGVEEKTWTRKK
jgi:hypothetical protein